MADRLFREPGLSFEGLRRRFEGRAPSSWRVKPVAVEVELTHRCNLRCGGCAILTDVERGEEGLDVARLLAVLTRLSETSVYAYSLTGGEPFVRADALFDLVARSPLDLFKLQTNGGAFHSPARAEALIGRLLDAGFGRNARFLRPSINVSIGMQTAAGVPLDRIAYLTEAFLRLADARGNLVVNLVADGEKAQAELLDAFESTYRRCTGETLPRERLLRTHGFDVQYTPRNPGTPRWTTLRKRIEALPPGYACFNFDPAMPSPVPRVLLRADGNVFPCACFGFAASPGTVMDTSIDALVERMGQEDGLVEVATRGLPGLLAQATAKRPELGDRLIPENTSVCKVCKALREPDAPLFPELEVSSALRGSTEPDRTRRLAAPALATPER